ncbi:MAG: hypothetical protein MZW92_00235 [Comamonadaceae bacterium]|nr:hypothetical protein [Comamonadaceae bacterium]
MSVTSRAPPPRPSRWACESFVNEARLLAQLRPPVAGQGLPLLGGQRHRLHGDAAATQGRTLQGSCARRDGRRRPTRPGCAALLDAAAGRARGAARRGRVPPRHRARQHPASATTAGRCCSTSAPRGA